MTGLRLTVRATSLAFRKRYRLLTVAFFRLGCSMRALARPTMAVISEIRAVSNFNISMSSDMDTTFLLWKALFGTEVAVELVPNIRRSY